MSDWALPQGFDSRTTPARADIAAAHLEGRVPSARYVEGEPMRVAVEVAPLLARPDGEAALETQALHGESLRVYDRGGGFAFVQLERDGYVGYIPLDGLRSPGAVPTHRIAVPRTHVYPAPDMKRPPRLALPMNACVTVTDASKTFVRTEDGFVPAAHVRPLDEREPDPVAVARRFLDAPYLWGGRTVQGIDCSGLVQAAFYACGREAPRDSDMMAASLGTALPLDAELAQSGDLVFWRGHVGLMSGPDRLLHANAHHMLVVEEPFRAAVARIAAHGGGAITALRRS